MAKSPSQVQRKLYEIALEPIDLPRPSTLNLAKTIPTWCQGQWDRLVSLGINQFAEGLVSGEYKDIGDCVDLLGHSQGLKMSIDNSCTVKEGRVFSPQACRSFLFMYRSRLIDIFSGENKNYGQMPLTLLLNKIASRLMQDKEVWRASATDLRDMAAAVKDLEPNNSSTYRILATVEMLLDDRGQTLEYVRQGLAIEPKDEILREIWFLTQASSRGFNLEDYAAQNTNDELAQYYLAAMLWKKGDRMAARDILKKLMIAYPKSERYKETWNKAASSGSSSDTVFSAFLPIIQEGW